MIIFLNGSINADKSTIAKLLVQKLHNAALVEINTLSVIKNFTKQGTSFANKEWAILA